MKARKIIVIVGPTASGKTGLGVKLARELNGEIVSADSRQVYRGLNIGSGKEYFPDVKQWLIDVASPGDRFTLFDWLPLAREAIEDIFSRDKIPIVVGGTGLYVQALIEGFELQSYGSHKEGDNSVVLDDLSIEQLQQLLQELDPTVYEIVDKNNPHRLRRAIERIRQGLKPVKVKPDYEVLQIGIDLSRSELYKKIDDRVEGRFREGMLEEVIGLIKSGVDINWLIKLGLEYRIITEFIISNFQFIMSNQDQHPMDLDIKTIADQLRSLFEYSTMKQVLKYRIHAFARRQLTWFRRFPEIIWLADYDSIIARAKLFIG